MTAVLPARSGRAGRRWWPPPPAPPEQIDQTPTVPYPATVARPGWADLPPPVRDAIDCHSGQPVVTAAPAPAGFSGAFAAVLTHADGSASFCKAAPAGSPAGSAYAREAAIVAKLPPAVPAARLRWHDICNGWILAGYDAVPAPSAGRGWTAAAGPIIDALAHCADALTLASPALQAAVRAPRPLPAGWADIAARRSQLPPQAAALAAFAPLMARWEAAFLDTVEHTRGLAHYDLRPGNVLINDHGRVWLADWSILQPGPSYVDVVMLAVAAADDGADPQRLFDRAAPAVSGEDLEHALAWLSGSWLACAGQAPQPGSAYLRAYQLRRGLHAWRWLAERHQLPVLPAAPTGTEPLTARRREPTD